MPGTTTTPRSSPARPRAGGPLAPTPAPPPAPPRPPPPPPPPRHRGAPPARPRLGYSLLGSRDLVPQRERMYPRVRPEQVTYPLDVLFEPHDELGGRECLAGERGYEIVFTRTEANQGQKSPYREASDRHRGILRLPLLQKKLRAGGEPGRPGAAPGAAAR